MISIPLWPSGLHPCSYLDGLTARSLFVDSHFQMTPHLYAELLAQGFRRSGDHVYRPYCQNCQSCVPVRINTAEFAANRQQRRCRQRHSNTRVTIKPAVFDARHYALFQRYQHLRHEDGEMCHLSADEYMGFLGSHWCDTWFVEFAIDAQLVAVAAVDVVAGALSAVYTFFDPDFSESSPGVFAVLWQIEQAQQLGLPHLYLGYWIKQCPKMRYKSQYQPLYGLVDQQWLPLQPSLY